MKPSRAVLITGCSTGIGRTTAQHLAERGWTVYATARRPEAISDLESHGWETVAKVIEKAITAPKPRARYTVTPSAKAMIALRAALPDAGWDRMVAAQFPRPGA